MLAGGSIEITQQRLAQSFDAPSLIANRARLVEHAFQFENGGYEVESADMTRLIAGHIEPEFVKSRILAKNFCEPRVQAPYSVFRVR